jgi:hypothetical protein
MRMSASVYTVILNGQRLADHDSRAAAEAQAAAIGGTVRLLDRRAVKQEVKRPVGYSVKLSGPRTDAEALAFFV